jgi:hypothetical protein
MLGNLQSEAAAALEEQIETLTPSAMVLTCKGFSGVLADALVKAVNTGTPDIAVLRSHGLDAKTAVAICEAIGTRHARVAAALAKVPEPVAATKPTSAPERIDQFSARSLLHDICLQIGAERGDATELHRAGLSWGTSKELADIINSTRI